jgi:hypothetical protein
MAIGVSGSGAPAVGGVAHALKENAASMVKQKL